MQVVGCCYVVYFNWCYLWCGMLWEGCYCVIVIEGECYFLFVSCVVEMSLVCLQFVVMFEVYCWLSYWYYVGFIVDSLIIDYLFYWVFGNMLFDCQWVYKELCEQLFDEWQVDQLQQVMLKGWVFGGENYCEWVVCIVNWCVLLLLCGCFRKVCENMLLIQQ